MKLSRKMKLALGLSLGAVVTTAAVTTMAVSCGESSDQSNTGNNTGSNGGNTGSNTGNNTGSNGGNTGSNGGNTGIVTSANYNPTPELASKISQADIDRMNVNLQDDVDEAIKGLESEGATNIKVTGIVKLEGDVLSQITSSSYMADTHKLTTVFTTTYKLTKNSDGNYLVKEWTVVTQDGKEVSSGEGVQPVQYVTLAELQSMIGNLYNNTKN